MAVAWYVLTQNTIEAVKVVPVAPIVADKEKLLRVDLQAVVKYVLCEDVALKPPQEQFSVTLKE